jgi:hypothetical protein
MKLLMALCFSILIASSIFATPKHVDLNRPFQPVGRHLSEIEITINVNITTSFLIGNTPCTDHITGTITLGFNLASFTRIIRQKLTHDFRCGGGSPIPGELRYLRYDESANKFTAAEFEKTGSPELDEHLNSEEFQNNFLENINSQLSLKNNF